MTVTAGTGTRFTLQVDPDGIDLVAARYRGLAHELQQVGTGLAQDYTSIRREDWSGAARDSLTAELSRLGTVVQRFPQHFEDAAAALTALATTARDARALVDRANADWEQSQADFAAAQERARQSYRTAVANAGDGADPALAALARDDAARTRDAAISRAASARDVADRYTVQAVEGAVAGLEEQARRTAVALAAAVVPGTIGPGGVAAAPADLAATLALPLTEERYRGHWDEFSSQEEAEQFGRDLAADVGTLYGTTLDPAVVDRLLQYAGNTAVARGLYEAMTPEGFASAAYHLARSFEIPPFGPDPFGGSWELRKAAEAQAEQVVRGLGLVLVTLSHDPRTAPGLADALVRTATTDTGSAYGLGVIAHFADGVDRDVARAVATGLYDAERSWDDQTMWLRLGGDTAGPPYFLGRDGWVDGMVAAEELLGHDPELAQEFLLGADGHGGTDRLEYLLTEHSVHLDDGDALGRALASAVSLRGAGAEGTSTGWRSADILSRTLRSWQTDDGYDIPRDARDSVGTMLGMYFREVQNGANQPSTGLTGLPVDQLATRGAPSPWGPVFGRTDVDRLLEAVVADDDAFAALVAGQQTTLRADLAALLSDPATADLTDDELDQRVSSLARSSATSWGAILDTANLTNIAEAQEDDARVQLIIDVVDSLTGADVFGLTDLQRGLPKTLIEQVVAGARDPEGLSLHGGHEGSARGAANTAWQAAQDAQVNEVVSVLFEQGYFDRDGRYAELSPEAVLNLDHHRFLGPGGHLLTPEQMQEAGVLQDYESWLTQSGVGNHRTTIGQAFDTAQRDYQG